MSKNEIFYMLSVHETIEDPFSHALLSLWGREPCIGSSSSLGRWHPRSSVLLVLTRHSSPTLNERWTRVINLSMFFLLCYDFTTILRSRALHRVLSSAIQYAWRSYMLCRLYRKAKTVRSDLLTSGSSSAIQCAWRSYMSFWLYRKVKTFRSDLPTYLPTYLS
jgi:hypothetical protein